MSSGSSTRRGARERHRGRRPGHQQRAAVRDLQDAGSDDEATSLADDQRPRFCACVDVRRTVTIGDEIELAIDEHLHFFDPGTGAVLGDA